MSPLARQLLENAFFSLEDLRRAVPAINVNGVVTQAQAGTHYDALLRYVIRHKLPAYQRRSEDRLKYAQDYVEYEDVQEYLLDNMPRFEGFVMPGGEFLTKCELHRRIPPEILKIIDPDNGGYVNSEHLAML